MDRIPELPEVIAQGHKRIIGERTVPDQQKILSAFEPDVQVIVRRKAGREVESGHTLFIAESAQG